MLFCTCILIKKYQKTIAVQIITDSWKYHRVSEAIVGSSTCASMCSWEMEEEGGERREKEANKQDYVASDEHAANVPKRG